MSQTNTTYATRPIRPEMRAVLDRLQAGQRIKITQKVTVGLRYWDAIVQGTFRHLDSLATGLATHRFEPDDIIVPIVHFTKEPHGELSSIAIDENTQLEILA